MLVVLKVARGRSREVAMYLDTVKERCPHCGEVIELVVDCSVENQDYIEDCQVCCRPIGVIVLLGEDGYPILELSPEF